MWTLKMPEVHSYAAEGRDNKQRCDDFRNLIIQSIGKKCLQIGVFDDAKWGDHFITLDLYDRRPIIDYNCDLAQTPFEDNLFDIIVCNAILEHVKDPFACAKEMYRIMKPGGQVWVELPFLQPYHPNKLWQEEDGMFPAEKAMKKDEEHGGDYWRFTPQGAVQMMVPFNMKKVYLVNDGGVVYHGEK